MKRLPRLIISLTLSAATLAVPLLAGSVAEASSAVYVVHRGDSLYGIARTLDVSIDALLNANGLSLTSVIVPGQRLHVPGSGASSSGVAASSGRHYTVAAGDTLFGIATAHGVSLTSLLAVNGMGSTSLIVPGMRLSLPAGASAPRHAATGSGTAAPSGPAAAAISFALAQVGKPYVFFTAGPGAFDCSGLTMAAYSRVGVSLIHQAAAQARRGRAVDFWSQPIKAGDLVFLDGDWDGTIDHVGMALGPTTWVQASQSHDRVMTGPLPPRSVIIAVRRFVG